MLDHFGFGIICERSSRVSSGILVHQDCRTTSNGKTRPIAVTWAGSLVSVLSRMLLGWREIAADDKERVATSTAAADT